MILIASKSEQKVSLLHSPLVSFPDLNPSAVPTKDGVCVCLLVFVVVLVLLYEAHSLLTRELGGKNPGMLKPGSL